MTTKTNCLSEFWDRKALTTEFSTPLPTDWLDASGLQKTRVRILDAGCGQGRILESLASSGWCRLWGVDYSAEMVRCALRRLESRAEVCCAPLNELPFDDASFDLVLCFGVVNTIADDHTLRSVFVELARVTAKQGILLINDYGLGTAEFDRSRYLSALPVTGVYGRFKSDDYTFQHRPVASLTELLHGYFNVERMDKLTFTTMTARKRAGYRIAARRAFG